jgi:hypothetical protein
MLISQRWFEVDFVYILGIYFCNILLHTIKMLQENHKKRWKFTCINIICWWIISRLLTDLLLTRLIQYSEIIKYNYDLFSKTIQFIICILWILPSIKTYTTENIEKKWYANPIFTIFSIIVALLTYLFSLWYTLWILPLKIKK